MRTQLQHLSLVFITTYLLFTSCGGWLKSPARDDYKAAKDSWKSGHYALALYQSTKSVTLDPGQKRPKEFVYENFDEGIAKIKTYLEQTKVTQKPAVAAKRHETYNYLVQTYKNIGKMKLPLKHPKGKWKWTTEMVDYTNELELARTEAQRLYYETGINALIKFDAKAAHENMLVALNKYTTAEEKEEWTNKIYNDYIDHAKKYDKSDVIIEAYSAFICYANAETFKESDDVKQRIADVKLHISDLWVIDGKEKEAKNTLESLKEANTSYEYALNWNEENEEAKELRAAIKDKIAAVYYERGLAAQKQPNRDLAEVRALYQEAQKWSPDYKDVTKRFYTFDILLEMQNTQAKIDQTIAEHKQLDGSMKTISSGVNSISENVGKFVDITERVTDIRKAIQYTTYALKPLGLIPYVGQATKVVEISLKAVNIPIKTADKTLQAVRKPAIEPAVKTTNKAKAMVDKVMDVMGKTNATLTVTKSTFSNAESCLMNLEKAEDFERYAKAVHEFNKILDPTTHALKQLNSQIANLQNTARGLSQIGDVFGQINEQMKAIDPVLNEINKVTKEIDKVLSKNLVAGISVKKILKEVEKFQSMAQEFIQPYLEDLLGIQIPQILGIEMIDSLARMVETEYRKVEAEMEKVQAKYDEYMGYKDKVLGYANEFRRPCFGKSYLVQSVQEYGKSKKGFWDIGGQNQDFESGQNLKVWQLDDGQDRQYFFENLGDGYFRITSLYAIGSGYVDVDNNKANNGTNIHIWEKNNSAAQKFKLKHLGEGRYKIYTSRGRVLCLAGRSSDNGTNVHIWEDHQGAFIEWVLLDPETKEKVMLGGEKVKDKEKKKDKVMEN